MNTTYTFPKLETKDFNKVLGVLDAQNTATYTLLLNQNRKENTSEEIFRDKYAKIGTRANSGKQKEGSAPAEAEKASYEYVENACEIFKKTASASASAITVAKRNGNDIIKDELQYALLAIKADINKAFVSGTLSKTDPRATAGLTTIVKAGNTITGELTKENIEAAILKVKKQAKGQIYLAVSTADLPAVAEALLGNTVLNSPIGSDVVAGVAVTKYKSIYGPVVNLYCEDALETGKALVFDIASVKIKVLRDFFQKTNSKDFDGEMAEIICEIGLSANPYAVAYIKSE